LKLIYIIGVPGVGKTTLMKEIMNRYEGWKEERVTDLLDSHVAGNVRVLGKYEEGEVFAGTDKLSMAVAPKAIDWVRTKPNEKIIAEGDRLNSKTFFKEVQQHLDLTIIHLTASDDERQRRFKERGSDQSEKFLQTTKTKCENVLEEFGDRTTLWGEEKGCVVEFAHETPEDTIKIADYIVAI
jgi:broad-specificity NMP kinase